MPAPSHCLLPDRAVLALSGPDAVPFLQSLVSNDVTRVSAERGVYSTLLTPQGRFLFDFFIVGAGDDLLLDCEAGRAADLQKRLTLYRMRSKVTIENRTADYAVAAAWGEGIASAAGLAHEAGAARLEDGTVVLVDPRLAAMGIRAIGPRAAVDRLIARLGEAAGFEAWDSHRIALGVPDGSRDIQVEKGLLLEHNLEELNAIDFKKGCYIGQELTARTKYRGLVKKRLFTVTLDGPAPEAGTPVLQGEHEAGVMGTSAGGRGLALLRLEDVENGAPLKAGETVLKPAKPAWAGF